MKSAADDSLTIRWRRSWRVIWCLGNRRARRRC